MDGAQPTYGFVNSTRRSATASFPQTGSSVQWDRMGKKVSAEDRVREIRRKTRKKYSAEEKVRIVIDGIRGEISVSALCRREGINSGVYYKWLKDYMEAGKSRLKGDTLR